MLKTALQASLNTMTKIQELQSDNKSQSANFFTRIAVFAHKMLAKFSFIVYYNIRIWGYGAVGSASEWHSEGQGFESPYLHRQNRSF